ncbi:MAG: WecB/TagA/CpsF family glycosyltransferase [Myxococcota bacterium]
MMERNRGTREAPQKTGGAGLDLPAITLQGFRFAAATETRCVAAILAELAERRGGWVITPNLDILRQAASSKEVAGMLREADLLVPDGMPLVWASWLQGTPVPERVAGSHLVGSLSRGCAREGRSVFLLGGSEGAAEAAAEVLRQRNPRLDVRGTHCPAFGFEKDAAAMEAMRAQLRASGADVVFVALGFPKQERLIRELRAELPEAWWLGVGISFSYLAGDVAQAPGWMQQLGLEWVHRLSQEPKRLAERYLVHDLPFAFRLLGDAARARRRK